MSAQMVGDEMGFLIKSAFWLSLVLLVIPFGSPQTADGQPTVGPVETFFAARAVIDDVSGFCERKPQACAFGESALATIGVRAREGARIAYGMIEEEAPETAPATVEAAAHDVEPIYTGSVPLEVIIESAGASVAD